MLENQKPSTVSVHSGWTSLGMERGMKMSHRAWLGSMLAYTDNPADWETPSLTGQCNLFRKVVSNAPDRFVGLINEIIANEQIPLAYPQAGMEGLLDADRIEDAMQVLGGILGVVENDINSTKRGFNIQTLLYSLHSIDSLESVPKLVVELLCNALANAKEPAEDVYAKEEDIFHVGINQVRGNAGFMLVKCANECEQGLQDSIFTALEEAAPSASIYTRAAILSHLAVLNHIDEQRCVALFKRLVHDYNPRLMAMPIHNYNPLCYFVRYAVDELMEFFLRAADTPECYNSQVIVLYLAWIHNNRNERVGELLDRMCDTSEDARLSLLGFLKNLNEHIDDNAVCHLLRLMEPRFDSPKLGEEFDLLFCYADSWREDILHTITNAYVDSPLSRHRLRYFVEFLGGYAIKNPIQTLRWLERVLESGVPDDRYVWNSVVDVVVQSYNGIKSFNDSSYQATLERAMDLIDTILQHPSNKSLIYNFINKLDNE